MKKQFITEAKRMQELAGIVKITESPIKDPQSTSDYLWNKFNGDFNKIDKFIDQKLLNNINNQKRDINMVDKIDEYWKEVYRLILDKVKD